MIIFRKDLEKLSSLLYNKDRQNVNKVMNKIYQGCTKEVGI